MGRPVLLALGMLAVVWGLGCESPVPPELAEIEHVQPIVLEETSPPIYFEKLVFRIPYGTEIGSGHEVYHRNRVVSTLRWTNTAVDTEAFNVNVTNLLEASGYDARDVGDTVFSTDSTVLARLRLAGVVTTVEMDSYFRSRPEDTQVTARVDVDFRLYDARTKTVTYEKTHTGRGVDRGLSANALDEAVADATAHLLADEAFVHAVLADDAPPPGEETFAIHACPLEEEDLPKAAGVLSKAVVTVRVGAASGTGFIVSPDGYALTAAHLLGDETSVVVILPSGLELDAERVRTDEASAVALLRVPGRSHPCVAVARAEPAVGDPIFVIASPLDQAFHHTVTNGILSANREYLGRTLLQTNASVNPGSSGGPLLDQQGRVVGIVMAKMVGVGLEGMAFGTRINEALDRLHLELESSD